VICCIVQIHQWHSYRGFGQLNEPGPTSKGPQRQTKDAGPTDSLKMCIMDSGIAICSIIVLFLHAA